jgi:hypothetical protein
MDQAVFKRFSFQYLNNAFAWLVFVIALFTYGRSIEPTASFWDCGEYIACAYKLEVGHPPGAPFFLLVGRVFSFLGGSDPSKAAMMINFMSAMSGAFTMLFLFWTISRIGRKLYRAKEQLDPTRQWAILGAAFVGSLACTFTDTFWFNSVEGEVYALSSLFTSLVFWAILKWDEEDDKNPSGALRWIILISYLIGLSIGVHLLSLLTIPAIVFVIYFKKFKTTKKGFFITGVISIALLGFVQDLLIPKVVKFLSDYEVFFTNRFHLSYGSGTFLFFALLVSCLTALIIYTVTKKESLYKFGFYTGLVLSAIAFPGQYSHG